MSRKESFKLPAIFGGDPQREDLLIFGKPHIEQDEIDEVVSTLRSGWIGRGKKVDLFEANFKEYVGAKFAVALNSCTSALHLSLITLGIKEGDEVITTPLTFSATCSPIVNVGAKPVFVDVEVDTMNIDPKLIEKSVTERTKAIIPVHFAGRPCEMDSIKEIAKRYNLFVIEDAAHALGAIYKGKKIGSIGDITCFSFYVTKNITTAEGGMLTTDIKKWANMAKILSLHGIDKDALKRFEKQSFSHYRVIFAGFKYNMTDIQASLGIHQLKRIEKNWKRRHEIWKFYKQELKNLPLILPADPPNYMRHAYHLFPILLKLEDLRCDRDIFANALIKENIGVGIHYISLHLHPYYKKILKCKEGDFPNAEFISKRTISIPFSSNLSDKDAQDVVKALKKLCNYFGR